MIDQESPVEPWDVLVVGAGPAGLTAAVYLARYRRKVLVVHDGTSRALRIPLTHNAPGFPGGVAGTDLMSRMEDQARRYGAEVRSDRITALRQADQFFVASGEQAYHARAVILATGIELHEADLPHELHEEAIRLGCLRYCPVCDGYEATDRSVGVIGSSAHGAREALFLRGFTKDVTLMPRLSSELSAAQRSELEAAGVRVIDALVSRFMPGADGMRVVCQDGTTLRFDVVYPALGSTPRADLASQLGLRLTEEGCLPAASQEQLPTPGVFAAGDVVEGLDQISVAAGHGAIAATKAHNYLRERDGHVLHAG